MKKIAGILTIIFTFFMCNSVVYGEGETVYAEFFTGYPEYKKNYQDYQHNGSVYLNGYPYWYNDYNLGGVYAHCLEAGEPFASDKISWTKTNYTSNSGITAAYLYILNNSSEQVESLAVRMMYAYINKDYRNSDKTNNCVADNNDTGPVFKCVFAKASNYKTMGEIEDNCPKCFDKYGNGNTNLAPVYNEAVSIYNSASVGSGKLSFEIVKINADSIQIKSKYGNTIYVIEDAPTSVYIPIKGNLKSEEYYYTIDSKYYKNSNTLYIYIKGTISIYSHVDYQDMMVVNRGDYTKIKINDILQCNVSPKLNPKNSNFNVTEYKNAGCLCKTYNTTKEYNQADFNAISNHAYTNDYINKNNIKAIVKTSVEKLQEEYINQCPPPCKIETSCSGLDNTCGDNVGLISTKLTAQSGMDLAKCLASDTSSNKNVIDPEGLLYKSNVKDGVDPIYCLESMGVYLGKTKIKTFSKGDTFGVYPYLSSKITCASKNKMITNLNIINDYYTNFSQKSDLTITDNSTNPKTFSSTPSFVKLDKNKIKEIYTNTKSTKNGNIKDTDLADLSNQLLNYISKDPANVFIGNTYEEMKSFDFNANGTIDSGDVEITNRVLSFSDNTVYLYFLPKTLYSKPILGPTYSNLEVYNLGYTFALNYGLDLKNDTKISNYSLKATLSNLKLTSKANISTCLLNCKSDIYYHEPNSGIDYCTDTSGNKYYYSTYYNKDKTKYSMCNIDDELNDESNFNEAACKEAIPECNPFDVGGIDYWYRPITLNDVFPNTKNDTSKKSFLKNKYRVTGSNWATKKGRETQQEIEKDGEKIYKNNTSSTTKNKVYYKITLTPQNMKEIRDYNDDQEKYDEGYADFTLDCDDKGFACKSSFLTDLLDENYGDYNDNEFNLSNARNWTKYTDGTAWK